MSIDKFIKDQRRLHQGAAFAGPWSEQATQKEAVCTALKTLAMALEQCREIDMRTPEVLDALAFLKGRAVRPGFCDQFERALHMEHPDGRWQNANAALNGIRRQFQVE